MESDTVYAIVFRRLGDETQFSTDVIDAESESEARQKLQDKYSENITISHLDGPYEIDSNKQYEIEFVTETRSSITIDSRSDAVDDSSIISDGGVDCKLNDMMLFETDIRIVDSERVF